jgi:O-methyltransferase involved in polyketide biosynthesis
LRAGEPSQTARGAAAYRAIHQTLDGGTIFRDPVALRILDDATRATLDEIAANPSLRPWRLFIAARSRFSEDILAASVARGARRIVVLGAGLDTFSLRNPHEGEGVRVYEVDYPGCAYLTRETISVTLDFIAAVPESEVVFDYAEPFENYPPERRENIMATAAKAAARGEPWLSLFDPAELTERFYGALKQGITIGAGAHVVRAAKSR